MRFGCGIENLRSGGVLISSTVRDLRRARVGARAATQRRAMQCVRVVSFRASLRRACRRRFDHRRRCGWSATNVVVGDALDVGRRDLVDALDLAEQLAPVAVAASGSWRAAAPGRCCSSSCADAGPPWRASSPTAARRPARPRSSAARSPRGSRSAISSGVWPGVGDAEEREEVRVLLAGEAVEAGRAARRSSCRARASGRGARCGRSTAAWR